MAAYLPARIGRPIAEIDTPALQLGQKLLLVPGHCDPTVNRRDWYVCVRGAVH